MMKSLKPILTGSFCIIIFAAITNAQSYRRLLPTTLYAESTIDTLINTSKVLSTARVKELLVFNPDSHITKTFATKRALVNKDGKVIKTISCFRADSSGYIHCIEDTLVYELNGRLKSMKITDAKNAPLAIEAVVVNESETKYTAIWGKDTSLSKEVYDKNGRLIHYWSTIGSVTQNTRYFYTDGLLDSINYNDKETQVFEWKSRRNGKVVETRNPIGIFARWDFNQLGQCIRFTAGVKEKNGIIIEKELKKNSKSVVKYFYNNDGTLLRVVEKSGGKPTVTLNYKYVK